MGAVPPSRAYRVRLLRKAALSRFRPFWRAKKQVEHTSVARKRVIDRYLGEKGLGFDALIKSEELAAPSLDILRLEKELMRHPEGYRARYLRWAAREKKALDEEYHRFLPIKKKVDRARSTLYFSLVV